MPKPVHEHPNGKIILIHSGGTLPKGVLPLKNRYILDYGRSDHVGEEFLYNSEGIYYALALSANVCIRIF